MKILALKMLSMKIFFQILFVWQENDLVFSSKFEKIALKNTTHTRDRTRARTRAHIKIQHAKGSINGSQGKGTHVFYKTIKLV